MQAQTITTTSKARTPIENLDPKTRARVEAIRSFVSQDLHVGLPPLRIKILESIAKAGALSRSQISNVWFQTDRIAKALGTAPEPTPGVNDPTIKRRKALDRGKAIRKAYRDGEITANDVPEWIGCETPGDTVRYDTTKTPRCVLTRARRNDYRKPYPQRTPRARAHGNGQIHGPHRFNFNRGDGRAPLARKPASVEGLKIAHKALAIAAGIFGKRRAKGHGKPTSRDDWAREIIMMQRGESPQIKVAMTPAQRKAKQRAKTERGRKVSKAQSPKAKETAKALFTF